MVRFFVPNVLNTIAKRIGGLIKIKNCDHCLYVTMNSRKIAKDDYQEDIKKAIARIIKENEKYFIYEIRRTTVDHVLHGDNEILKNLGYSHAIALEIFEKYGSFMYVSDLCNYVHSPRNVKYELEKLIHMYGLEMVTEEIAIYLKDNYSERFEIKILCSQ